MLSKCLAATAGVAIACCAFVTPAARADAAPASACTAQSGVIVIVDFSAFGGDIERGCDPGAPATALEAMHTAGFATAGTSRYGDAFVCRIDGRPSPTKEACTDTPPASSSWSFYYARPTDRRWTYSAAGVLSHQPPAGTLLAFAFGNDAKPRVLPSGATVTTTTTTTAPRRTTVPPTSPVTAAGTPTATTVPGPAVASTTSTPASTTSTTKRPTETSKPTGPNPSTTIAAPRIVDKAASAPVDDGGDPGSPLPAILTIVLVAGLGATALAVIRTRRRRPA